MYMIFGHVVQTFPAGRDIDVKTTYNMVFSLTKGMLVYYTSKYTAKKSPAGATNGDRILDPKTGYLGLMNLFVISKYINIEDFYEFLGTMVTSGKYRWEIISQQRAAISYDIAIIDCVEFYVTYMQYRLCEMPMSWT